MALKKRELGDLLNIFIVVHLEMVNVEHQGLSARKKVSNRGLAK